MSRPGSSVGWYGADVPRNTDVPVSLEAWLALLRAHADLVARVSAELEAACGISLARYDVLFQLLVAPDDRLRMHELASAVLLSPSGLTRLVDRMEQAGLVARETIPGDRRSLHVRLTAEGKRLVTMARRVVRQSVERHLGRKVDPKRLGALRDTLGLLSSRGGRSSPPRDPTYR